MNNLSNDYLYKVIKEGGKAVGKSQVMPGQTDLSDKQVQDLIAFVRTIRRPPKVLIDSPVYGRTRAQWMRYTSWTTLRLM